MHKGKTKRQFQKFRIYKDLYGKPCKDDWVAKVVFLIQMLLTFGGCCNRCFWDIRLKMLRLPNFNMVFNLVLTNFFKSELFSCLPKVDLLITVMQRAYCETRASLRVWKIVVDMLKFHLLYKSDIHVLVEFCYKGIHCSCNFILSIVYLFPLI